MDNILYLCISAIVIGLPICIGGYIVDKLSPEDDEEVMEYEKQIQQRKRAARQRKSRKVGKRTERATQKTLYRA